jgi:transcriptional regulator with XRE-family HTH domain
MSTTDPGQLRPIHSPEELGAVISELRSLRRKTQFEVSAALSIDRSQLAHLEGGRSGRYLAHLLDILNHLGAELQIHWPTQDGSSSPAPTRAPKLSSQAKEAKRTRADREANAVIEVNASNTEREADTGREANAIEAASAARDITAITVLTEAPSLPKEPIELPTAEPNQVDRGTLGSLATENVVLRKFPHLEGTASSPSEPEPEQELEPEPEQELEPEPEQELEPEPEQEAEPDAKMAVAAESSSAQPTKITNMAMNVMAASQQLTVKPIRPVPTIPTTPD